MRIEGRENKRKRGSEREMKRGKWLEVFERQYKNRRWEINDEKTCWNKWKIKEKEVRKERKRKEKERKKCEVISIFGND